MIDPLTILLQTLFLIMVAVVGAVLIKSALGNKKNKKHEQCPKCTQGDMVGPKFTSPGGPTATGWNDRLEYLCNTCGYKREDYCDDDRRSRGNQ